MKMYLEPEDIKAIALAVAKELKPIPAEMAKPKEPDKMLNVKELAKYLNVSEKWIYARTHYQEIPFVKLNNGVLRFKRSAIDKWAKSFENKSPTMKGLLMGEESFFLDETADPKEY